MNRTEDDHSRAIIHIDLDCFYAQVETIKNPQLANVPLGIQQKNIVVTCNYKAREFGVTKCMLLTDAQKVCPNLVLVNGEDLHDYRDVSYKVTSLLQRYTPNVERLGLDENYLDVTELVRSRIVSNNNCDYNVLGNGTECECGCFERLCAASALAKDIRDTIKKELQLTSCAGVGHNKLLAKLAGAVHKPNQQTTVFPTGALELMCRLKSVTDIPGVGRVTAEILSKLGVNTVSDLQNSTVEVLSNSLSVEKCHHLIALAYGIDSTPVKASGRPQTIGIEDSCRSISGEAEVRDKLTQLLNRLMVLVDEDGRVPRTIKLTVRLMEPATKISHREQKQINVNQTCFSVIGTSVKLTSNGQNLIMKSVMGLFRRMVDLKRGFHITLLGLSFTKFLTRAVGNKSIESYLTKYQVQTLTNIECKANETDEKMSVSSSDYNTDGSESDVEPSPKKKKKFAALVAARRRCMTAECPSPSKLNVAELKINSDNSVTECPPNVDPQVFSELPREVQVEVWQDYMKRQQDERATKKPKVNTLLNYFLKC